jgi:DinB superfamily
MASITMDPAVAWETTETPTILEFIRCHVNDEWDRLVQELRKLSDAELALKPAPGVHSIGWHIRHAIEWRYALVHVLICGHRNEAQLSCLGWENEPLIHELSSIRGWHEPSYTVVEDVLFAQWVREVTENDLLSLSPARYWDRVVFPWRTNRLLDEIFQDTRHFALHRGQIRQIRKSVCPTTPRNTLMPSALST